VEGSGYENRSRSVELLATAKQCGGRKSISQTDCPYHLDRICLSGSFKQRYQIA